MVWILYSKNGLPNAYRPILITNNNSNIINKKLKSGKSVGELTAGGFANVEKILKSSTTGCFPGYISYKHNRHNYTQMDVTTIPMYNKIKELTENGD